MRVIYLNKSGSRWRNYYTSHECGAGQCEEIELETVSGQRVVRKIKYWFMWGNFSYAKIKYNNKLIDVTHESILDDELPRRSKLLKSLYNCKPNGIIKPR